MPPSQHKKNSPREIAQRPVVDVDYFSTFQNVSLMQPEDKTWLDGLDGLDGCFSDNNAMHAQMPLPYDLSPVDGFGFEQFVDVSMPGSASTSPVGSEGHSSSTLSSTVTPLGTLFSQQQSSRRTKSTRAKSERRKAQNRAAQRAFRDRHKEALKAALKRVEDTERELEQAIAREQHFRMLYESLNIEYQRVCVEINPSSTASQ